MKEPRSSELNVMTSRMIWTIIVGIGIPILATATGFILKIQFTPLIWFIIAFWFLAGVGATIYTATDRLCASLDIPVSYLMFYSITEEDIPEEKRESFRFLQEPMKKFLMEK